MNLINLMHHNKKFQIITICTAITLVSLTTGLSAYLTDITDEPLTLNMNMRYGDEFNIKIADANNETYTDTIDIFPGSPIDFQPVITNMGNYDTYVFMEIDLPDQDFSILGQSEGDWTELERDDNSIIYAYGSPQAMTKLDNLEKDSNGEYVYSSTTAPCTGLQLDQNTDLREQPFSVSAVGYAIQTEIGTNNPTEVWNLLQDEWHKKVNS